MINAESENQNYAVFEALGFFLRIQKIFNGIHALLNRKYCITVYLIRTQKSVAWCNESFRIYIDRTKFRVDLTREKVVEVVVFPVFIVVHVYVVLSSKGIDKRSRKS